MANLESENELEDYLFEKFNYLFSLKDIPKDVEDFEYFPAGFPFRQLKIKGYGTMDIFLLDYTYDSYFMYLNLTVVELKKGAIDYNALGQICRYKTAIERFLEKFPKLSDRFAIKVNGLLIGESIQTSTDMVYILNQIDWLTIGTYQLSLKEGIKFDFSDNNGWHASNEDFTDLDVRFSQYFHKYIKSVYKDYLRGKRIYKGVETGN